VRDDDAVLERTEAPLPGAVTASGASLRILELVDGKRSVREIVLHAHAPEFLAQRLLAELVRGGVLRVIERSTAPESRPVASRLSREDVQTEARRLLDANEPESALRIVEEACRLDTTNAAIHELRESAESACFAQLFGRVLGPHRVPVVVRQPEACTPEESFLLTLVDGTNDVRALVWLAPMRALAVVRSLKNLLDSGAVVLRDE